MRIQRFCTTIYYYGYCTPLRIIGQELIMVDGEFSTNVSNDGEEAEFGSTEENTFTVDEVEYDSAPQQKPRTFKNTIKRILIAIITIALGAGTFILSGIIGSGEDINTISPVTIQSENNNKLIYITGTLDKNNLSDPIFNISTNDLGLLRIVEMYQWTKENESYMKKWSETLINIPDEEAKTRGFSNPTELPFLSQKWLAEKVTLGKFTIAPELVKQLEVFKPLPLTEDDFKKLHPEGQLAFKLAEGGYFFGINPAKPNIGDLRISFKSYPLTQVSILAKQTGESLEPYLSKNGSIGVIRNGIVDITTMTQGINLGGNAIITITLRTISITLIIIGLIIAIGKKPFSGKKKNKNQKTDNKKAAKKDNIPLNIIPEDEENIGINHDSPENIDSAFLDDAEDNFMIDDNNSRSEGSSYIDPIYPTIPNTETAPKKEDLTTKISGAPTSLEFTSVDSNINAIGAPSQPPSQLSPFGIMDNPDINTSPDIAINTYAENSQPPNYASNEYATPPMEKMPFEVEVLSDNTSDEVQRNIPSLETNNEIFHQSIPEITQHTTPYLPTHETPDLPIPPYNESNIADDLIPSEVEVISEIENVTTTQSTAPQEDYNSSKAIDFYPDLTVNKENHTTDEQLPNTTQTEDMLPPLPPLPDFDTYFKQKDIPVVETIKITSNETTSLPLPPTPDFDSLFFEVKANKAAITGKPAEPIFDLGSIPNDFDPNVEMSTPKIQENLSDNAFAPIDDDLYSPFGGGIDDPFATPEDEKK